MKTSRRRAALYERIPGGEDGRRMLWIALINKAGTGLWMGAAALYFTLVAGLSVAQVGILMGVSGAAGIAGAPLTGHLADRFPSPASWWPPRSSRHWPCSRCSPHTASR